MNAFDEGVEAYHRGDSLENDNPFDGEDGQYDEWIQGWNCAAQTDYDL